MVKCPKCKNELVYIGPDQDDKQELCFCYWCETCQQHYWNYPN